MNKQAFEVIKKLEKTTEKYWNIGKEAGQFLNLLIKDRNIKKVLEIGASNGYSAIWMGEALKQTGGHLYTIESHKKERYPLALKNIEEAGLTDQITAILGHAPESIPKTPKFFDLVLLDATKYEHLDYLEAILPRIKRGSIIITDNVISHKKDLLPYLKALQKTPNLKTEILNIGSGLAVSVF